MATPSKSTVITTPENKIEPKARRTGVPPPDPDSFAENMAFVGPGLVTGASDDDPSGIATYSQAGAQFGFGTLWLTLFSYPLMCAIQEISARIGRVTGVGIAANIRKMYPRPVVYAIVAMLLVSSIFNLGADLGAMGESAHMLFGGPAWIHLLMMGLISIVLQIFVPYTRYVKYLKFLVLSLMAYVVTAFLVPIDWPAALRATIVPPIKMFHGDYLTMVVAVLGTTISPYLFFWQASQEAEEVQVRPEEKPLQTCTLRRRPDNCAELELILTPAWRCPTRWRFLLC